MIGTRFFSKHIVCKVGQGMMRWLRFFPAMAMPVGLFSAVTSSGSCGWVDKIKVERASGLEP